MILIDSNIVMYLVGGEHPHKADARALIERHASVRDRFVTDAEVYQEILHRYAAISRRDAIQAAFDALDGLAEEVFPVGKDEVARAKAIVLARSRLSARDAIHVAVMEIHGIERVISFDRGFDSVPGITRIH